MVKAIKVTKKYSPKEVRKLAELFLYLNDIDGLMDEYKYWVSAKWLWKLLEPLTRTEKKKQEFRERWESVSNISRLKENEDYVKIMEKSIKQVKKQNLTWRENSQHVKNAKSTTKFRGVVPVTEIDYILTLRAGEYCATLTKWDSGDLYRRFIFDIKDEFIRLVFRWGKSIDTRTEFTTAISDLDFVKKLDAKEQGNIYAYFTNIVYKELQEIRMTAKEYKAKHKIAKKEFAKHYFDKDGLLNFEKIENKLATVISYIKPKNKKELEDVFWNFFTMIRE